MRHHRLAGQEHGLGIDGEGAIPVFFRVVRERHAGRRRHARVVHQNVDLAQRIARAIDHGLDVGGAGHVGLQRERLAPQRLDLLGHLLGVERLDVGNGDVGAFARHREDDAAPDAASSTRHDRHLAGEPHALPPILYNQGLAGGPNDTTTAP